MLESEGVDAIAKLTQAGMRARALIYAKHGALGAVLSPGGGGSSVGWRGHEQAEEEKDEDDEDRDRDSD
jgi:hypothetical protein